jgi:hypothetical protein
VVEVELIDRQFLPVLQSAIGKSRIHHRQFAYGEPANRVKQTGKNCRLSVRDQLLDKSFKIRVIFSEKDRSRFLAIEGRCAF